jgi:nitroreductase
MSFDSLLKKRHCTRHFKALKPVRWKHLAEILDSARYAPCAGGIFTVKIIVVDDKKLFPKIADACLGQSFISQAKYILVVCSDMEQVTRSYGKHADVYTKHQAGAAIENMFLKAADMGIGTCWIGAFDENVIKRILDIPEKVNVEAILPIGYEQGKEKEKEKILLKRIVKFNEWTSTYKDFWPEPTATSNE